MDAMKKEATMKTIVKPSTYIMVFVALLVLTGATVRLSYADAGMGAWHSAVGLAIAAAKALLIMVFFMHVLRGMKLIWLVDLSALFWLAILMVLTLTDYLSRSWLTY